MAVLKGLPIFSQAPSWANPMTKKDRRLEVWSAPAKFVEEVEVLLDALKAGVCEQRTMEKWCF